MYGVSQTWMAKKVSCSGGPNFAESQLVGTVWMRQLFGYFAKITNYLVILEISIKYLEVVQVRRMVWSVILLTI